MSSRTWLPALVAVLAAGRLGAQTVEVSKLDESTYRYAVTEERRSIFAARFFQIDDYVTTASRMNLLSGVPLVAPPR